MKIKSIITYMLITVLVEKKRNVHLKAICFIILIISTANKKKRKRKCLLFNFIKKKYVIYCVLLPLK